MARRFLRYSIQELEAAFVEYRPDAVILGELVEELKHRETDRAAKLRAAVEAQLRKLGGARVSPEPPLYAPARAASPPPNPPATSGERSSDANKIADPHKEQNKGHFHRLQTLRSKYSARGRRSKFSRPSHFFVRKIW
jgi:hypothetical protein